VHDAGVVPGLMRADRRLLLQHDNRRTRVALLQGTRHRQPDNPPTNHHR